MMTLLPVQALPLFEICRSTGYTETVDKNIEIMTNYIKCMKPWDPPVGLSSGCYAE